MEKSGNLTSCVNIKVLFLLRFNFMISVSVKMLYREVMKNCLRSGRTPG